MIDYRFAMKGKGVVVKFLIELDFPNKWREGIKRKVKKIQKLFKRMDRNRRKFYAVMWLGVFILLLVTAYGRNELIKQTIVLESGQYYVWWYENKYKQNWIDMNVSLSEGGSVVYFHTTNIEFVNWIELGYVLVDEVQEFRVAQEGFNGTFDLVEKKIYYFVYYAPTQEQQVEIELTIWSSGLERLFMSMYLMAGLSIVGLVYEGSMYYLVQEKDLKELRDKIRELEREKEMKEIYPKFYSTEELERMNKMVEERIQIRTELVAKMDKNKAVSEEVLQLMKEHNLLEKLGEITQLPTIKLLELYEQFTDEMEEREDFMED